MGGGGDAGGAAPRDAFSHRYRYLQDIYNLYNYRYCPIGTTCIYTHMSRVSMRCTRWGDAGGAAPRVCICETRLYINSVGIDTCVDIKFTPPLRTAHSGTLLVAAAHGSAILNDHIICTSYTYIYSRLQIASFMRSRCGACDMHLIVYLLPGYAVRAACTSPRTRGARPMIII